MNTLGGVNLPSGLVMQEAGHSLGRRTVTRQTLDGPPLIFAGAQPKRLTLIAGDDYGWFDEATKDALIALATASDTADLTWGGATDTAAFDHENGPAVTLTPLYPGAVYYSGAITLIIL